ncbi:MAG: hypothetical protein RBR64_06500 [Bacteroidales bacterium]|jgi:hypothetical protein|nr:hypothetical protein [Bacteroidales bacterium]
MKKLLLIGAFLIGAFFVANAQVNSNAVGIRLGGGTILGAEFSYQKGVSEKNRLEIDLGWNGNPDYHVLSAAFGFHWDFNIIEGFNWFVGPAVMVGMWTDIINDASFGIGVGAQGGVEYDFGHLNVPVLVSIDVRPLWNFQNIYGGLGFGSALGVRYIF